MGKTPSPANLDYDPHLDPQLVWAGKKEHTSFEVHTAVVVASSSRASATEKYKTPRRFTGRKDCNSPHGNLVFDAAGNLYGTTMYGVAHGGGCVFKANAGREWHVE